MQLDAYKVESHIDSIIEQIMLIDGYQNPDAYSLLVPQNLTLDDQKQELEDNLLSQALDGDLVDKLMIVDLYLTRINKLIVERA